MPFFIVTAVKTSNRTDYLSRYLILPVALCPGVYSASNRNEYQRQKSFFWGVKHGWYRRLTTLPPSVCQLSRQCGILNISQLYMPPRPITGIAFSFKRLMKQNITVKILMEQINGKFNNTSRLRRFSYGYVPSSPILVTLMMAALSSSETLVLTRATWHNIPDDAILHVHASMSVCVLRSSSQTSWLLTQSPRFDSRCCQIFWVVVGLE
jgi:hypothetical protein